jgi:hypothetical protein
VLDGPNARELAQRLLRAADVVEHKQPADYDTDPKSQGFMAGAPFDHRIAVLKHLSKPKFEAIEFFLMMALRDEFTALGTSPKQAQSFTFDEVESLRRWWRRPRDPG